LSKSAENGFGAASRAVLGDRHTDSCPNQVSIITQGGWDVCDSGHGWFVRTKVGGRIAEVGTLAARARRKERDELEHPTLWNKNFGRHSRRRRH
jgi:hypothetical protein